MTRRHPSLSLLLAPLVLAFCALAATDAVAQTPPKAPASVDDVAKAYYERGVKLFEQQQFVAALGEFAAGYEISRRPLFLWNMGECARLSNQGASAREYYDRYLTAEPTGQFAELARKRLEQLGAPPTRPDAPPVAPSKLEITANGPQRPDAATRPVVGPPKLPSPAEAAGAAQAAHTPPSTIPAGPGAEGSASTRWYRRWPIWAAVGAVVVGGSITAYALTRDSCSGCTTINLRD